MKKILCAILAASALLAPARCLAAAVVLEEANTGTVIYEEEAAKQMKPHGLLKLMSLLVFYEAVNDGTISLKDDVTVSKNAAAKGGSRAFLDSGASYTAEELLGPVLICGANDAMTALAEACSGSEEAFVKAMNDKAGEMGLASSFADCTGLAEGSVTTPRDMAAICCALTKYSGIFKLSSESTAEFVHKSGRTTNLANPNKLIKTEGFDGLLTGSDGAADYGVAATFKSGGARYVAIVMGAEKTGERFDTAKRLTEEAAAKYGVKQIAKAGGKIRNIPCEDVGAEGIDIYAAGDLSVLYEKGGEVKTVTDIGEIRLPLSAGQKVGTISAEGSAGVDLIVKQDYRAKTLRSTLSAILRNRLGIVS